MKKNLFTYILLIILLTIPNITFGLLSDPLGLDMYKKVDKWLYDLELKYLERELKWWDAWWSIVDDLKKRFIQNKLDASCIKWDLSAKDVEKISTDDDAVKIFEKISKDCFWENKSISSSSADQYINVINESFQENSKKAEDKVKKTYEIWRIWMYSDWLEENSPFDLMVDIDNIDKVIFEQNIPYNWVNTEDLWKVTDWILSWLSPNQAFGLSRYKSDNIIFNWKYKDNTDNSNVKQFNDWSNQICETNNSWLSEDSLNKILWELNKNNSWSLNWNNSGTWNNNSWSLNWNKNSWWWGYSKVNDNSMWPCNEFFCIVIKFVMYQHNLLGWWKNLSIEWLIKRSNAHFKKFASTSLIQSNMTTNLFQIWLKDLNLPDIFHVWTQVSYKPVPIMNVEKDWKDKASDEFKHKNLLTRYYKNLGLDYERANDLKIFKQIDPEVKSILEWTEMTQTEAEKKENSFSNYLDTMKKENEYISNTIVDKKVITEDMNNFYKQFAELESFTNALLDYTIWAWWVIKKMNEIPKKW